MTDQNTDALRCAEKLEAFAKTLPTVFGVQDDDLACAAHIRRLVVENEAHRAAMRQALEAGKELHRYYAHIWDRVDGCAVIFPDSIPGFEAAVEAHAAAISTLKARLGDE